MLITLYGALGQEFGREHKRKVRSVGEAVRALCATLPGFKQRLRKGHYFVRVSNQSVGLDHLHLPVSEKESISIIPAVAGAGDFGDVLLGAALIGWSFMIPGSTLAIDLALSTGISVGTMASFVSSLGVSLLLGGVSRMLFTPPTPEASKAANNLPSYAFDGVANVTSQGSPVPVCYGGPIIIGSQVISSGLTVEEIAID